MREKTKKKINHNGIKERYRHSNLDGKIALVAGILLAVMLAVLIVVSVLLSRKYLMEAISSELSNLAAKNALQVQAVVDDAASAAGNIQNYIARQYEIFDGTYEGERVPSQIYTDTKVEDLTAKMESYMLNTAWSAINGSEYIAGIGYFFEPYAFDRQIKDYAIYIDTENAEKRTATIAGDYSAYSEKDYYKTACQTQNNAFTDPYEFNGKMMITAAFPVVFDGKTQAVVVVDVAVDEFAQLDLASTAFPTLYGNVINSNGIYVYDARSGKAGENMKDRFRKTAEYEKMMQNMKGTVPFSMQTSRTDGTKVVRFCHPIEAAGEVWWSQTILDKDDMQREVKQLALISLALAVAVIAVIIYVIVRLVHKLLSPMKDVVAAAEQLAVCDFSIELKADSEDEIGQLTRAFSRTVESLRVIVLDLQRGMEALSNGNFDIEPEVEYHGEMADIKEALESFIAKMSATLTQIDVTSDQVAENAGHIASGAVSLTEGATEQAGAIQELQSSISEVAEEVDRNAKSAEAANEMAREVGDEVNAGNEKMQEMVQAMNRITESSNQIRNIINTINDIASQTNLLALNASIEAARAGELGKGFAVVATEVGNLAAQSAEAAKSSTQLIADAIKAVENGRELADVTAAKLADSVTKTQNLVENIENISRASVKQASELDQVAQSVEQIAAVIEENTAMAEQSSASSQEVASQAQVLKELIKRFKLKK